MKIYTRTGDDGTTGLYGGDRVAKSNPRIEAIGAVDELNAQLGVARATGLPQQFDTIIEVLQNHMLDLGAELATSDPVSRGTDFLQDGDIERLERWIDATEANLAPLQTFILPGGTSSAAAIHMARCICRRAERQMNALAQNAPVSLTAIKYINRVGDLLFVLARSANAEAGCPDIAWRKSR